MAVHPLVAFITSFVAAAVLMRWLLALCHKRSIYDVATNPADSRQLVPRIGGAVFLPSLFVGVMATLLLRLYGRDISDTIHLSTIIIGFGTLVIYVIGILDDLIGISRMLKRILKLVVCAVFPLCALVVNNLYGFLGVEALSPVCSYVLTFFATFLIVGAVNAADDTDGLAGTYALIFVSVLGIQFLRFDYFTYAYLAISLAGALVVYLYYNLWGDVRIGTKVHMGNCGSLTLGFTLAYLSVKYAMDNKHVMASRPDALLTVYSLLILPLFDYIVSSIRGLWLGDEVKSRRELRFQAMLRRCRIAEPRITLIMGLWALWFFGLNKWMSFCALSLTWIVFIDVAIYTLVRIIVFNLSVRKEQTVETDSVQAVANDDYEGEEGMVSVIMPTWNSSRFVAESIDSVLAQTYKNIEIIITDDASSDSTPDILREYAERDSRVRIILNKENGGAGRSRNCSIRAARGQYIAFCDSDDRWDPTKIEKQVAFMREKEVALAFCPYYTCGEKNEYLGYVSAPRRVSLFEMMCDNKIGFLTAIYDTRKLGKHLMPSQRKRQDHALLLMLLTKCKFAYSVPEALAHYRLHAGNMSANKMGLLRYNAKTYNSVFGWPAPLCWTFLFTFFMPTYFWKRAKNLFINISRTQLG